MSDTDAEDMIASLAGGLAPADRERFRREAEATLALCRPNAWDQARFIARWCQCGASSSTRRETSDARGGSETGNGTRTISSPRRRPKTAAHIATCASRSEAAMAYWAATQLQPHRERVAEHFLQQFGFEVYLPRVWQHWHRFGRRINVRAPLFASYCFTRIELQWHGIRQWPGVIRVVRSWGHDEPTRVPDEVIDALRARKRDGAIDLPNAKRGRKNPRIGDRVQIVSGPFVGHSGLCTQVSRQQVGVLLLMFKAQRQVRLRPDAVELC
jgi:transcription antitermination factor NusG